MNDFKQMLRLNNSSRRIDEKILLSIQSEFEHLETLVDVDAYRKQIVDRKKGVVCLLSNFEKNMGIIEGREEYRYPDLRKISYSSYKEPLDAILREKIAEKLDELYNSAQENLVQTKFVNRYNAELEQILNRRIRLSEFFKHYEENMGFIEDYYSQGNIPQEIAR